MSSKTTENKTGERVGLNYHLFWSSITGRLAFLYTLSAFGMLLLSTVFLYWVLTNDLERDNNKLLADEVRVLRLILREHPANLEILEQEVKLEGAAFQLTARVLDERG